MKDVLMLSGTYTAALIGAGMASGAETTAYFARYGKWGGLGILLCCFIFGFFLYAVIRGCQRTGIYDAEGYAAKLTGKKCASFFNICIILFMICVYSAMIAASGEMMSDITGINNAVLTVIFNIICILIVMMPIKRIMNIFGYLGMLIAAAVIFFSIYIALNREIEAFNIIDNWAMSSISYSGYNILSAVCILCPMSAYIKNRREALYASIISGISVFLILVSLWGCISIYYGKINLGAFPMLTLALRQGQMYYTAYIFILLISIFTTAVSCAYGVYSGICKSSSCFAAAFSIFLISTVISCIGFSNIINIVYRLCGITGIVIPILIIKKEYENKSKKAENAQKQTIN